jgi:hypothetical protein
MAAAGPTKAMRWPDDLNDDDDRSSSTTASIRDDALTPSTSASTSPSLPPDSPPSASPPPAMLGGGCIRYERRRLLGRLASVPASYSFQCEDDDDADDDDDETSSWSSSHKCWKIPASRKSHRTRNPIRAIVDPIMAAEQARMRRDARDGNDCDNDNDATTAGKDQISLAVSFCRSDLCPLSCVIVRKLNTQNNLSPPPRRNYVSWAIRRRTGIPPVLPSRMPYPAPYPRLIRPRRRDMPTPAARPRRGLPSPIIIVISCGPTMRWRRRRKEESQ